MGKVQDSLKNLRNLALNYFLQNGNDKPIEWVNCISPYIPDDDGNPDFEGSVEKEWSISTEGYVNLRREEGLITVFYDERGDPEEPTKELADYNQILFWDIDKAEATAHRILAAVATYRSENEERTTE